MRCAEIEAREPLWRRGELHSSASRALRQHLARCRSCRRGFRTARAFDAALRAGLEEAAASAELRGRLRRSLAGGTHRPPSGRRAPVALALGLALLCLQNPAPAPAGARSRVVEGWLVCQVCASHPTAGRAAPGCMRRGAGHRTGVQTADGTIWRLIPASEVLGLSIAPGGRGARVRLSVRDAPDGRRDLVVESARLL